MVPEDIKVSKFNSALILDMIFNLSICCNKNHMFIKLSSSHPHHQILQSTLDNKHLTKLVPSETNPGVKLTCHYKYYVKMWEIQPYLATELFIQ